MWFLTIYWSKQAKAHPVRYTLEGQQSVFNGDLSNIKVISQQTVCAFIKQLKLIQYSETV